MKGISFNAWRTYFIVDFFVSCQPICSYLLFIVLAFQPSWSSANDEIEISESEYHYIHTTANEILSQFPRDKFYYLGVGRSPTALIAYLQLIDINMAGNLPFSKGKWARDLDIMSDADIDLLKQHFVRFLPSPAELRGRAILLIDHTQSGLGLKRVRHYIRTLLGDKFSVESVALVFKEHDHQYLAEMVDHKLVYDDERQTEFFAGEKYDAFAAYEPAIVAYEYDKLKDVKANPRYSLMVNAVERAIRKYSACEFDLDSRLQHIEDVIAQALSK